MFCYLTGIYLYFLLYSTKASEDDDWLLLQRLRQYWTCEDLRRAVKQDDKGHSKCPISFDGWLCWPSLDTGQDHEQRCPGSDNASVSRRHCHANGTWTGAPSDPSDMAAVQRNEMYRPNACGVQVTGRQNARFWRVISSSQTLSESPYDTQDIAIAYEDCAVRILSQESVIGGQDVSRGSDFCTRTFDGWNCWNDTRAGDVAFLACPNFVYGLDPRRLSHKVCTSDGTWLKHPQTNRSWSNYTTCIDHEDLVFRHKVNALYIAGYSVSLTALVVSLVLFFVFNLKCGRVTIHKNLFVSFILNNILWIVWYTQVVHDTDVIRQNKVSCQVLHIILHYFLVSNYFWMFCEGFYLHTLLVLTFVAETKVMRTIYVIGWGAPFVLTLIYALVRMYATPDATVHCWLEMHRTQYILVVPVCLSLLLNLAFLVNIVRVLVTKLRAVNSPDSHRTRKAARATLILIPLLGLHFAITPFRPDAGSPGEWIYEIMAAVVASLQGFCVALLFCFFNGEVISLVKKKWTQEILMRQKGRRTSYAATTISFSTRQSRTDDSRQLNEKLVSEV